MLPHLNLPQGEEGGVLPHRLTNQLGGCSLQQQQQGACPTGQGGRGVGRELLGPLWAGATASGCR